VLQTANLQRKLPSLNAGAFGVYFWPLFTVCGERIVVEGSKRTLLCLARHSSWVSCLALSQLWNYCPAS